MITPTQRVPVWRFVPWIAGAALLVAAAVAMRLTSEMRWSAGDFALFAVMLAGLCGAFELAVRLSGQWTYRLAATMAAGAAFLMVWANLAVGLVGSDDNPANLTFFGVLAIGTAGAVLARFRARGMARTMLAMAVAQALAALVEPRGFVLLFTAVYIVVWLAAGWLFRRAAQA